MWIIVAWAILCSCGSVYAYEPDWSEGALVPTGGRSNPYELELSELQENIYRGRLHALVYPVSVTGSLIPFEPVSKWIKNFWLFTSWMGLHKFPHEEGEGIYQVPFPDGKRPSYRMGLSLLETTQGRGATFSCVACHSAELFGRPIIGMTNRFSRANHLFFSMEKKLKKLDLKFFQKVTGATDDEVAMLRRTIQNLQSVEAKKPLVLGLDTSLAHVALSLSRRSLDPWATPSAQYAAQPQEEVLRHQPADSKPAVWWTLKYKNRWLSDGSLVSGNPILTNFIWNEIGRGVDLRELQVWLESNTKAVQELTTAVFQAEPPPITDFFALRKMDIEKAQRGEQVFLKYCSRCHGVYEKQWSSGLQTTRVIYPSNTPVIDVGTDPYRYQGMESLAQRLNPLAISQQLGIVIRPQKGYVPPPLIGIWARWPYFHNNAAPSLCAVLTRQRDRPSYYYAGPAEHPAVDFDFKCNGYPSGVALPPEWKRNRAAFYDSTRKGLSNAGHDEGIFLKKGEELLSTSQKFDLIHFLQTL